MSEPGLDGGTAVPSTEVEELSEGLTRQEDDELRELGYLARFGTLDGIMLDRLRELRVRDRRTKIREPRARDADVVATDALRRIIPPSQRSVGP